MLQGKYLRQGLIIAALFTPLIIATSSTIFPFIFPKAIFFEIVVGLLLAASVPYIYARSWRPFAKHAFFWLVLLYIVVLFLSAVGAFDMSRALWSNFERMTGVIFIVHGLLFGLLVAFHLYGAEEGRTTHLLFRILLWVSVAASVTGLIQLIDPTFLNAMSGRVAGVFGNPIYLGGFAAECLLFTGYFLYSNWHKPGRFEYIIIAGIQLLALYFSGTRSALLALAAGVVYLACLYIPQWWAQGHARLIRRGAVAVVLGFVLLLGVVQLPALRGTQLYRFFDVSAQSGTASTRFIAWEIAWKGFKERPVFGWGSENYFYVFNKFFNPQSQLFGSYETWFDHAHNAPLEVLVTQGVAGFVLYIGQYALLFFMCLRLWFFYKKNTKKQLYVGMLGAYIVAHFVHNIFVFDHPASYMLFYLIVGIIFAEYVHMRAPADVATNVTPSPTLVRMTQAIVVLCVVYIVVPSVRQNILDLDAQRFIAARDFVSAQQTFESALAIQGPHTADVLLDIGRTLQSVPPDQIKTHQKYFNFGVYALQRLLTEYEPANVLAALLYGQVLTGAAAHGDTTAAARADETFRLAAKYSPQRQQVYYGWARLKFIVQQPAEGIRLMETAIALQPDVALSHWHFATMLMDVNPARAAEELSKALALKYILDNPTQVHIAALIFTDAGNYSAALDQYRWLIDRGYVTNPTDPVIKEFDDIAVKAHNNEARQWIRLKFPVAPLPPIKK